MDKLFNITAKTFEGLEDILIKELKNIGADSIEKHKRAVSFRGNKELMYKANLQLRTALRILVPIKIFRAENEKELYKEINQIKWDKYLNLDCTFKVDSVVNSEFFNHSQYVALKTKDAIVDFYMSEYGTRPSIDTKKPDLTINIRIYKNQCTLSLDSSGESLHRRGYRKITNKAPLNEVLAAGLVMLSGWKANSDFIDPMCGSGTILIEAAMYAFNIPPNMNIKFGFMKWANFDADLWKKVKREAVDEITDFKHKFYGFDISTITLEKARENIKLAGLSKEIKVYGRDFRKLERNKEKGFMIFNPPYGERMKMNEIEEFYKMIGDKLKEEFTGYTACIFSANKKALSHLRLKATKKIKLFNGSIESKFHKFEMYK